MSPRLIPGRRRKRPADYQADQPRRTRLKWFLLGALLAAPGVWTLHLLVSYALVPPSCEVDTVAPLHLTTAVGLLLGGTVTWWSIRTWRRLSDTGGPTAVLALVVAALGVYFTVIIAMVGLTPVFQSPCY